MTYIATEKEAHAIDIESKVCLIKKDIGKQLEELRSRPGRVRIPFPRNLYGGIKSHIIDSPNDECLDDVPYRLEILHEGIFYRVDPIVIHGGYRHEQLNRRVTLSDVTYLYAAPGLLLDWRVPFDASARTQEIERRRKIGREIAKLKREIKALNSTKY